jgi:AraC-like DNA-binding protein
MDLQGGSIARVLKSVDLPFAILENPDIVVPLREQFRLLENAARETGDDCFGARLSQAVKSRDLSAFGAWCCASKTLVGAIRRAHLGLNTMLQTSTVLTFARFEDIARWSIEFVEPETDGRHHNEFLGLGYMIDTVRVYAGPKWRPRVIMSALPRGTPTSAFEEIFETNVSHGHPVPAIEFDTSLLGNTTFMSAHRPSDGAVSGAQGSIPCGSDFLAAIRSVAELALLEGYPRIEWVARKLGMTTRSLQRHLDIQGTSFRCLLDDALAQQATMLLRQGTTPVTEIALRLGYSDPAHFARAFRRWTGKSPSRYRAVPPPSDG